MDQVFLQLIQRELSKHAEAIKSDVLKTVKEQLKQRDEEIALLKEQVQAKNDITRHEKYYQRKLEELLGGGHAKTKYGEIDILTETTIYEIKAWKSYKNALGQLLFYAKDYPGKQLAKIFFGRCDLSQKKKKELLEDLRTDNIDVYQVNDELDGSVSLQLLNPRPVLQGNSLASVDEIIRAFIREHCVLEKGNKKLKSFVTNLWNSFEKWSSDDKVLVKIKHNYFCNYISKATDYDRHKKVRKNGENSTGWIGICLKDD